MTSSVVGVVFLLGGLIFFHEFGHFSVAKFFRVKVEIFSLGFGQKLIGKIWGETEYRLSLFPFGGYVKLMGDDPYQGVPAAEADRAFSTQKLYKRFLIVAAGPVANLLLAFVLFTVIFWNGKPVESNRIGHVEQGSVAWENGLRPGDRILEVGNTPITTWRELEETFRQRRIGEKVELKVERMGTQLRLSTAVSPVLRRNPYGEQEEVPGVRGIRPTPLASMVGVPQPASAAYKAGLRTGDLIIKVDNQLMNTFRDMEDKLSSILNQKAERLTVTFKRKNGGSDEEHSVSLLTAGVKPTPSGTEFPVAEAFGLLTTELFVKQAAPESPAETVGVKRGDHLVRIGNKKLLNFEMLVDELQEVGSKASVAPLGIEREGQILNLEIKPVATVQEDPITRRPITKYMLGIEPMAAYREAEITKLTVRDPIPLLKRAVSDTYITAERMLISIGKLIAGKISVKNLGGPVLIASLAGKSLDAGIIPFLQTMALISINLFLLNLLPIPVLDGGHLFFFFLEALKGKPVSIRTMEIANQVGMVFILMLVGLTLFNDISWITRH